MTEKSTLRSKVRAWFTPARIRLLLALVPVTAVGLMSKMVHIPHMAWIHNSLGGLLYVVFFILLLLLIFPSWKPLYAALTVFLFTSALEFAQLIHHPFLEAVRATRPGRALIGSTFNPADFTWYLAGAILGFLLVRLLLPPPASVSGR
ncbi:MAG: DUF2809 domain-containing protein [Bacteroidota bacterium]